MSHLYLFYILILIQDFLATFFYYVVTVMQRLLSTSFLTFFFFFFWIFIVPCFISFSITSTCDVIYTLLSDMYYWMFYFPHIFLFIMFKWFFFILIYLFNCLSYIFWIIMIFSLLTIQVYLTIAPFSMNI